MQNKKLMLDPGTKLAVVIAKQNPDVQVSIGPCDDLEAACTH